MSMWFLLYYFFIIFMCLYLYIYIYDCMFVSALPDPTCNSEKSANGGNKQILLLLLCTISSSSYSHMVISHVLLLVTEVKPCSPGLPLEWITCEISVVGFFFLVVLFRFYSCTLGTNVTLQLPKSAASWSATVPLSKRAHLSEKTFLVTISFSQRRDMWSIWMIEKRLFRSLL